MKWSTSRKKIFFVNSKEDCRCPCCGSELKYRDQRLRVHKVAGGEKEWYLVRRLKCTNDKCRKLHNELPDCICPYKYYDAGLVEDVVVLRPIFYDLQLLWLIVADLPDIMT